MRGVLVVGILAIASSLAIGSTEVAPQRIDRFGSEAIGTYSDRTLAVAVELDRDGARVVAFALKDRPYRRPTLPRPAVAHRDGHALQVEVVLSNGAGAHHVRRVTTGPLCLLHGPLDEPHVAGDTVRSHRDSFVVELPELSGMDVIDVAYHVDDHGAPLRRPLASTRLTRERFDPAAGPFSFGDVRFAGADAPGDVRPPLSPAATTLFWPEDFADPDIYRIEGDAAEVDSRINIVIVPDGYRYEDKAVMDAHFDGMVSYFRTKTPYKEHDAFINYVLVYAFSRDPGTDQCDCGIVLDTAMGTRFLEQVASCGDSANRCLYYGNGCDSNGEGNIVAAELRAPAVDTTVVMVNTTRYGGCGGARAVYSAANGAALEVAVHELGHSLAGLADEYQGNASCGGFAGGINTSTDPVSGDWPEWTAEIGAPTEGGQYYDLCIFRPLPECEMRSLNQPFCPVCNQRWGLIYFGHPRVAPTAPISGYAPPATFIEIGPGGSVDFSVDTRLANGPGVTNSFEWQVDAPGPGGPVVVAQGSTAHTQVFTTPGLYQVTCRVTADTNFIKPAKYGANQETVGWNVTVQTVLPPPEVSPPGALNPFRFYDRSTVLWENAGGLGVDSYNLYRGELGTLPAPAIGDCLTADIPNNNSPAPADPADGQGWFYFVTGVNLAGEGPAGSGSGGLTRVVATPCP